MTANVSPAEPSLAEQRRLIAHRPGSTADENSHSPRNVIMRFLMQQPTFAMVQLLLEWVALRKTKKQTENLMIVRIPTTVDKRLAMP